jgi:hypothetical protein
MTGETDAHSDPCTPASYSGLVAAPFPTGVDPLLATDAERARARAAADYHNRVGDPGHTAGM